jgi:hypothetical protein
VRSTNPKSDELVGRTIAIKDNIAVAGVKCTNGTGGKVGEWVPKVDATLVTRLLGAGGIIKGKAACENNCFGAVRYDTTQIPSLSLPERLLNVCSPQRHLSDRPRSQPLRTRLLNRWLLLWLGPPPCLWCCRPRNWRRPRRLDPTPVRELWCCWLETNMGTRPLYRLHIPRSYNRPCRPHGKNCSRLRYTARGNSW